MIVITSMDSLPDHCHECPCHDGESGYCCADVEQRYSDYRPYWCPLKELKVRELSMDEWQEWKKNPNRDPICRLWENDTSPMWTLSPNDVHEPALLMGKLKLFTGKPTVEQCKEIKWK